MMITNKDDWFLASITHPEGVNWTLVVSPGLISYGFDAYIFMNSVVAVLILLMNASTLLLFSYRRSLLKTPSNYIHLSLTAADFFAGLLSIFHIIGQVMPGFRQLECTSCIRFRIVADIMTTLQAKSTVMHLCGITLDRYISLFYALHYGNLVTSARAKKYILACWLVPLLASSIQFLWLYPAMDGLDEDESYHIMKYEAWYSMWSFSVFLAFPLILLGGMFTRMFLEIRRLLIETPGQYFVHGRRCNLSAQQRRVCGIFGTMYVCFLLFSFPYFSCRLAIDMNGWRSQDQRVVLSERLMEVVYIMKCITSLINPILYTVYNREFRIVIVKLCMRIKKNIDRPMRRADGLSRALWRRKSESINGGSVAVDSSLRCSVGHDDGSGEGCLVDEKCRFNKVHGSDDINVSGTTNYSVSTV